MPKFPISQMAQFVVKNSFTAAAAIFATAFASNEDRGYFRTALITTPVIFASSQLLPQLFTPRGMAQTAVGTKNLLQNAEKWTRFEQQGINDLNILFKQRDVPSSVLERAISNALVAPRKSRDFLKERESLTRLFNRKFVITQDLIGQMEDLTKPKQALKAERRMAEITKMQQEKGGLISNAMNWARRKSLRPDEWVTELTPKWEETTKAMTNDELQQTFAKFADRPEFIKSLRNRLREIKGLEYKGTLASFEGGPGTSNVTPLPIDLKWREGLAEATLSKANPDMMNYLESAQRWGNIDVTLLAEDVTSGKIGKALGVNIKRHVKGGNIEELNIPLVDMATGTVRLTPNSVGVADWVIDPSNEMFRIDTWIAKMLAEQPNIPVDELYPGGPSLKNELAAHAYWHAGDPTDARRMAELDAMEGEGVGQFTAGSRKLRSFAAKGTKLPLYMGQEGKMVSYRDLSATEQEAMVARRLKSGKFINMSSEAGTYEDRWVRREAAFLSPYGAPSAEKQDPIWRAVTKEFQLRMNGPMDPDAVPGWKSSSWEGLYGGELPAAKFTTASIDPQHRTAIMAELKASGRDDLADVLGRMGETGFVLNEKFSQGMLVEGVSKYNVDVLGVKKGDVVTPDLVMGFRDYDRVVPRHAGVVSDVAKDEKGFVVNVKHELDMSGAKVDIAGIKGMVPATMSNTHFEELRNAVNSYYTKIGSSDLIPEGVNTLAPTEYFANKVDPAHAYLGIGSELVKQVPADVSADYLAKMQSELGTSFVDGQLVIDAGKLSGLGDKEAGARLQRLSEISEEFFTKAGEALKKADIGQWMLKNQFPAMGFAWDHSAVNAPRFASFTYDIGTHMAFGQKYAGLRALRSRLVTSSGGSADQSLDFMKYVMAGKFEQPLGHVVPIGQAFPNGRGDLTLARNRANSIFDPSIDAYKANFSLDLGGGKYLPVPGTDAYGAEAKMYEPGKYQTRRWQNTLKELSAETDATKQEALRQQAISQYQEVFGVGKGNVLRPYEQDPLSVAGVFSVAQEESDPFTMRISKQVAEKVRSKRLREALMKGEEVYGMPFRQPINQAMYMRVRLDAGLAGMDMATSERALRAMMGDQDKDTAYLSLFDANIRTENGKTFIADSANAAESAAALEARAAITSGSQLRALEAWEGIRGTEEIANRAGALNLKSLRGRMGDFAKKVQGRVGVAINRTAGATIGSFSNVVTELNEHMLRSASVLKDPELASRLNAVFYNLRQAPISARKAPTFSLEQAMAHIGNLKQAMVIPDAEGAATRTHAALINLGHTLNTDFQSTKEYGYLVDQGVEDIQTWARGRSEAARMSKLALTATVDQSRPFAEQGIAKSLRDIFSNPEKVMGPVHLPASAESASKLGVIAEGLAEQGRTAGASVTGTLGKIFQKYGKTAAIGLGAVAALGAVMTPRISPIAGFSRASGNKFRPEEKMGVADSVPGEPVPGQMAPSAPPRRMGVAGPNVRTGVVAPMGQTSDLSVTMRATDRSRAAETARLMSQIPGSGDTNVTINYRDRTKIRSLRTREKIRDIMNG